MIEVAKKSRDWDEKVTDLRKKTIGEHYRNSALNGKGGGEKLARLGLVALPGDRHLFRRADS